MICCQVLVRRSARLEAPSLAARFNPPDSASWSDLHMDIGFSGELIAPPASTIAFWKSPLAKGEVINQRVFEPPPECPKIVTLCGLPPKAAVFLFTHFKAAIRSSWP